MWPCLGVSTCSHTEPAAITRTYKIRYMTMLLELAYCKVKQLFPGRQGRFYSSRQKEERDITSH